MNIVAGSNVNGKVTLYLKNVDVREVLKIIAQANDLAFVEEGNLIQVMTGADFEKNNGRKFFKKTDKVIQKLEYANIAEVSSLLERMKSPVGMIISDDKTNTVVIKDLPENLADMEVFLLQVDVPRQTEVFELSYAKAEDLSEKILPVLTPNVGSVRFDKRSNKFSITDTPHKLREAQRLIQAFDVKEKEVVIEAKIVQVILRDQFRMGINWQAVVAGYHDLTMLSDLSLLGAGDKKGQVSIGTLEKDNYQAMVEALSEYGTTNNLSNPHIMVINNQEAKILVGSTEPYVTTTTTTPSAGPTTQSESINFIDVGVKLYVTPMIHRDNSVTMKIKPEISSVTRTVTTGNNNTIPVVEKSEAETTVQVKDGATIVIGGLIKDENIKTDKKVPFFGDIPLLGNLFKSQDSSLRKTELVIFLTPRIVDDDAPPPAGKSEPVKEKPATPSNP